MTRRSRLIAAAIALPAIAFTLSAAFRLVPSALHGTIYDLMGADADAIPQYVRERSATLVPVLISSTDLDAALHSATALADTLPTNDCTHVRLRSDDSDTKRLMDFYASNNAGLASDATTSLLATGDGRAKVARFASRRAFASLIPSQFHSEVDPFGLALGFLSSFPKAVSGWVPQQGFLTAERDGVSHVLMTLDLEPSLASSPSRLVELKRRIDKCRRSAAEPGVTITACGLPMHVAEVASAFEGWGAWLAAFCIAFAAAFSIASFRPLRKLLPYMAAVAVFASMAIPLLCCLSSTELFAAESFLANLAAGKDGGNGVVTIEGGSLEELLDKERSLGLRGDVACLSRMMPPWSVRTAVAKNVARLYEEHGEAQASVLGLPRLPPPPAPRPWKWEDIPESTARLFSHGRMLVIPSAPPPKGDLPGGVAFCRPEEVMKKALSKWARSLLLRFLCALALTLGAIALMRKTSGRVSR